MAAVTPLSWKIAMDILGALVFTMLLAVHLTAVAAVHAFDFTGSCASNL
jgi:hypothetical protein